MPIRILVRETLAKRGLNQVELQLRSGLSYSAINELYHGKTSRLTFATLEALCKALDCEVGDLLEYVPEARPRRRGSTGER